VQQILPGLRKGFFGCCLTLLAIFYASEALAAPVKEPKSTKPIVQSGAKKSSGAKRAGKAPEWAQGVIYGEKFVVRNAFYGDGYLFLRSEFKPAPAELNERNRPDACNGVQIALPTTEGLEGRSVFVPLGAPAETRPELNFFVVMDVTLEGVHLFQKIKSTSPYSMVLKFFKINKGLQPGYIELHCPDTTTHPTTIKGYFYAQPATGNAVRPNLL
jgi:hypothetical protein